MTYPVIRVIGKTTKRGLVELILKLLAVLIQNVVVYLNFTKSSIFLTEERRIPSQIHSNRVSLQSKSGPGPEERRCQTEISMISIAKLEFLEVIAEFYNFLLESGSFVVVFLSPRNLINTTKRTFFSSKKTFPKNRNIHILEIWKVRTFSICEFYKYCLLDWRAAAWARRTLSGTERWATGRRSASPLLLSLFAESFRGRYAEKFESWRWKKDDIDSFSITPYTIGKLQKWTISKPAEFSK